MLHSSTTNKTNNMMGVVNTLLTPDYVVEDIVYIDPLTVSGLLTWHERDNQVVSGSDVRSWPNHSSLSASYDLSSPSASTQPQKIGNKVYFDGTHILQMATINLQKFTMFLVIDPDESKTLSNDGVIGRALNDLIKVYRGSSPTRISFRFNGVNYDINALSQSYPSGEFVMTVIRDGSGIITVRFNKTQVGTRSSTISNLFDVNQIGSGIYSGVQYNGYINELLIYNGNISSSDVSDIEDFLISRI